MRITPRTLAWLLRRTLASSFDDNCFGIAKGAAYSALLSFFPVLTSAATILLQTRAEFVSRTLEHALWQIVPPGTEDLVVQQFRVTGARPVTLLIVANVISLWAASSVIKSLIEGFQATYRVPRNRSFLRNSAVAISLVLLSAVPLLSASLLILLRRTGGTRRAQRHEGRSRPHSPGVGLGTGGPPLPLCFGVCDHRRGHRHALLLRTEPQTTLEVCMAGRDLATLLWLAATSGFAWYVRNIGHYNVMYKSVGAGIALLVWMYLIAAIALIGCEFNAEMKERAYSSFEAFIDQFFRGKMRVSGTIGSSENHCHSASGGFLRTGCRHSDDARLGR